MNIEEKNLPCNAEELLNNIFEITQELYKEISVPKENPFGDHIAAYRLLTDLGRVLVNADRASFWKWDKRSHELWTTAAVGTGRIVIPEGTGLVGKSLEEKRAIVENNPYEHPDFNANVDKRTGYVTRSVLVMPVSNCCGEFIGAYQAINKLGDREYFDLEEDVKRLSLAAFICGITLESENFMDETQHDKLTEIKNRMGFYNDYKRSYSRILADTDRMRAVSLIICDIDFFKKVNDTYGHNAGDAVLKFVADKFSGNTRNCDGVYRWGGEEFIVVLPDADLHEAARVAERFRTMIMNSACPFDGTNIKITMSFGVTEINPSISAEDNIKIADEKLYKAKDSGRNIVIS